MQGGIRLLAFASSRSSGPVMAWAISSAPSSGNTRDLAGIEG